MVPACGMPTPSSLSVKTTDESGLSCKVKCWVNKPAGIKVSVAVDFTLTASGNVPTPATSSGT